MPSVPSPSSAASASIPSSSEEGIVVIPQEFYGVALKMKVGTEREAIEAPLPATPPPVVASVPAVIVPPKPSHWPVILAVGGIVVLVGGVFVFLNRDLLFKKTPPPAVVIELPPPVIPPAPSNLTSAVGTQSVNLTWVDSSGDETD